MWLDTGCLGMKVLMAWLPLLCWWSGLRPALALLELLSHRPETVVVSGSRGPQTAPGHR